MKRLLKIGALGACGLLMTAAAPVPQTGGRQVMMYDVYAAGIHVLNAELTIDTGEKGRYDITLAAHTQGFLANLVPWKGRFESHGWATPQGTYKPEIHKSMDAWRSKIESKEYHYTQDGGFQSLSITKKGKTQTPKFAPELTKDTTDAFTGALQIFAAVAKGQKCEGVAEVFDGKGRYAEKFSDLGFENIKADDDNVFEGKAVKCQVEVKPLAGDWPKKPRGWMSIQDQGRQAGALPFIWLGAMNGNAPAAPVKIQIKTSYGTLLMELAEYKSGGKSLVAKSHD